MKKIFMIGHGPLPGETNVKCQTAFGLRTWQFLSILREKKFELKLILIADKNHYNQAPNFYDEETLAAFGTDISIIRVEKNDSKTKKIIKRTYRSFSPDICLGINLPAANILSKLKPTVPFWADLNGWSLTEGQSQAWIEQSNAYLPFLWQQEKSVLQIADKISTVANTQKYATYGELATLGRMNSWTDEYELVTTVPNANEVAKPLPRAEEEGTAEQKNSIQAKLKLPKEAFIVFFSGAYNTWLDSETMFAGLEQAIKTNPKIHFVSTGGAAAVSKQSLTQFKHLIAQSEVKDHFHFLGWITTQELHQCYQEVDLAINMDRPNHEAIFGARNRINEWVEFGVPVLSTVRSEVSIELMNADGIIGIDCRDNMTLTQKILAAANQQLDLKQIARNAQNYAQANWSYLQTLKPLINWLQAPAKSPDNGQNLNLNNPSVINKLLFHLQKDGLQITWQKLLRKFR